MLTGLNQTGTVKLFAYEAAARVRRLDGKPTPPSVVYAVLRSDRIERACDKSPARRPDKIVVRRGRPGHACAGATPSKSISTTPPMLNRWRSPKLSGDRLVFPRHRVEAPADRCKPDGLGQIRAPCAVGRGYHRIVVGQAVALPMAGGPEAVAG